MWVSYHNYVSEFVLAAVEVLKANTKKEVTVWMEQNLPPLSTLSSSTTLFIVSRGVDFCNLPFFPQYYVCHQIEQCNCLLLSNPASNYSKFVKRAIQVWEYSELNRTILTKRLNLSRVSMLKFSYHPLLEFHNKPERNQQKRFKHDVLFLGSICPRRRRILDALANSNIDIGAYTSLFGEEKQTAICNAKIVLNLHYYVNPSILETERIGLLLANKKCVVSEYSSSPEEDELYSSAVVFERTIEEIVSRCKQILANPLARENIENAGYEWFKHKLPLQNNWQDLSGL